MIQLSRWKVILVSLAIVFGLLFAAPNLLTQAQRDALPGWLPKNGMNLGLDLQGGSYLLLEVDLENLRQERVSNILEDVRVSLNGARVPFSGIQRQADGVVVTMDPAVRPQALTALRNLGVQPGMMAPGQGVATDRVVQSVGDNQVRVYIPEAALRAMGPAAVDSSITVIRNRIDSLGTREPSISRQGADRIVVQAPGQSDPAELERIIGQTAQLTFQMVDSENSVQEALAGRIPPDSQLLVDTETGTPMLVKRRVLVSGENLTSASVGSDQSGRPAIDFRFDGQGARRFGDATAQNIGRPFAIILDGQIISAPTIQSAITGGSGQITGNFSIRQASELVTLLEGGSLPAKLTVEERRTVGAGLGADAVQAGILATGIAFLGVLVFLILSYGLVFGGIAVIAIIANGILIVAAMSMTQATLTLPGIAGLILTLAMAVDASVIIYERMRDEARAGRAAIASADAGFSRAMVTIVDANLTTILAALIMFQFGAGPVRGFAWTLSIGVVSSVFCAVLITQILVAVYVRVVRPKQLPIVA
jgi:preprotein translocase subunit SecD